MVRHSFSVLYIQNTLKYIIVVLSLVASNLGELAVFLDSQRLEECIILQAIMQLSMHDIMLDCWKADLLPQERESR